MPAVTTLLIWAERVAVIISDGDEHIEVPIVIVVRPGATWYSGYAHMTKDSDGVENRTEIFIRFLSTMRGLHHGYRSSSIAAGSV